MKTRAEIDAALLVLHRWTTREPGRTSQADIERMNAAWALWEQAPIEHRDDIKARLLDFSCRLGMIDATWEGPWPQRFEYPGA